MAGQSVESRVESLERRVTDVEGSQQRWDVLTTQILQLQTEMREGFSAIRGEFSAIREEFRRDLAALGNQMRVLHEDVIARLKITHEQGTRRRVSRKDKRR
jgi:hypothetical protein